jgi:GNAT superfamily N-acetyltransferase
VSLTPPEGCLIVRLDTLIHDRDSFSCGVVALDEYLRTQASQVQNKNLSSTHVLTLQEEPRTVVGYVSLVTAEIPLVECPPAIRKLTNHPRIPVLLLARMAVGSNRQGQGLGEFLLKFALKCAWEINQMSGCYAVIVDAKNENVKNFYLKYGFAALLDNPLRLYLPVATLGNLL